MRSIPMMTVLVFHKVTDVDWFESVIAWLKTRFSLVPFEAVAAYAGGERVGKDSCHITVDDGDVTFAHVMFPVLQRYGVGSSLFVSPQIAKDGRNFWFQEVSGYNESALIRIAARILDVSDTLLIRYHPENILKSMCLPQINEVIQRYQASVGIRSKRSQNLSVSALQQIAETGLVCIGAHTMNHPILANESDATCTAEISKSIDDLRLLLGGPVQTFAYPNGIRRLDFGDREESLLRNMGIRIAFTTESRQMTQSDHPLRVPRVGISDKESIPRIKAKMLLGPRWSMLRNAAGIGEHAERERLAREVGSFHSMKVRRVCQSHRL
jgi:peptidoglycan/xylan/chitin deacetylase (PgdA/CDA1 family)